MMDQLWAPWRIDYVAKPHKDEGCFLCAAAQCADDRQHLVLWRGRTCFSMMNCWPYNNGHLMVAPLEHKADLADLSDDEMLDQARMLRRCRVNLERVLRPGGFNMGLNLGRAAGAGLPGHMHWHVVPRWDGDTNFMPVTSGTKVIPQSLHALWDMLRQADPCPPDAGRDG